MLRFTPLLAFGLGACTGTPQSCPSWAEGRFYEAHGSFSVHVEGADLPAEDEWLVGVETTTGLSDEHQIHVRACVPEFAETSQRDEVGWEPWVFSATWRLAGSVEQPMMIPGATMSGTPGMSGRVQQSHITCFDECTSSVDTEWLFLRDGAADLTVDVWDPDPDAPVFASRGSLMTDGATPVQVDLALELRWCPLTPGGCR